MYDVIDERSEKMIELCQEMVRIPSQNPPGDTTDIAQFMQTYLEDQGLNVQMVAPKEHMPNVVVTVDGGQPDDRHLVFNGHLDTYPAGDISKWIHDPFGGEIDEGRIFGRGVADMKGGNAAMVCAFLALAEHSDRWKGRASLTLVSDEETGGKWGTQYLLEHHPRLRGTAVLNAEPVSPKMIALGEKGMFWTEWRASTDGGHGAYTFVCDSATHSLMRALTEVRCELDGLKGQLEPALQRNMDDFREEYNLLRGPGATDAAGEITVNVGIVEGGTKVNMVAEECRAEVDFRLPPGRDSRWLTERLQQICEGHEYVSWKEIGTTVEPTVSPADHRLAEILRRRASEVRSADVNCLLTIGGTDCRFWRLHGVPAYCYGPTHNAMGQADEFIYIDEMLDVGRVLWAAAYDYLTD